MLINMRATSLSESEGYPLQIHPFGYSTTYLFRNHQNTDHRLNITFIFVRCHSSLTVATPVIFRRDLENIRDTFAKVK